jgi:hypothetical protein
MPRISMTLGLLMIVFVNKVHISEIVGEFCMLHVKLIDELCQKTALQIHLCIIILVSMEHLTAGLVMLSASPIGSERAIVPIVISIDARQAL